LSFNWLSSAATITGQISTTATVRHGTYQRRSVPTFARTATTTGSAISDHRVVQDTLVVEKPTK